MHQLIKALEMVPSSIHGQIGCALLFTPDSRRINERQRVKALTSTKEIAFITYQPSSSVSCRNVSAFAWGDDIVFSDATIVANKPEAAGANIVTVDVGTDIASGYVKPGQFIQMKVFPPLQAFRSPIW